MSRPPFVGRTDEIAQACSIVRDERGPTLVLLGPPGVGKTALLEAVRRRLEAAGLAVRRVVASTAGMDLPLAPFASLVDPSAPGAQDLSGLVVQVVNGLRATARQQRTVLMVDDAHDLDDASAVVVSQLAHGDELRVVLTARSTEPLPVDLQHLVDGPDVEVIEVRPLVRDATDELVRADLGVREPRRNGAASTPADVDPQVLDEIWRWSRGVPFHVRDLIDSSVESGALVLGSDLRWVQRQPLTPSARFTDAFGRRVEQLGPACARLVRALAVTGPLPVQLADSLATAEQRLAAERSGILRRRVEDPSEESVGFAHDLYGEAAASWLSSAERQRIAAEVAQLVAELPSTSPDDDLLRAELSLRAGELGSAGAEVYERGAEVACHRHYDGARCLRLADAALERGAGTHVELLRLTALGLLRGFDEASVGYADLEARVEDPAEAARVSSAHAWHVLLNLGDVDAAVAVLDRGAERVTPSHAVGLRGQKVSALFCGGRPVAAAAEGAQWIEEPSGVPPSLAFGLVSGLAVTGRAEEALRLAELQLRDPAVVTDGERVAITMVWNRVLAMWQLGRLGELAGPLDGLPSTDGAPLSSWMRSGMTGTFDLLRGRLADASTRYISVWDHLVQGTPQVAAMNSLLRAMAEAQLGRADDAGGLIAAADELPLGTSGPYRWWVERARIMAMAAQGAITEAIKRSLQLADRHPGEHLYVTTSLHDVVRFGRAKFVQERLARQAERPHASWWDRVCADHAAVAAAEHPDPVRLLEVAERFERGGRALEALEAAAQAAAEAGDGRAPGASASVRVAAASKVEELLVECGPVRTPALASAPSPLTEREFLVARLAAAGRSNADIARRLGTSVRTVGNQLQSVYQKLGLHSREELHFLAE